LNLKEYIKKTKPKKLPMMRTVAFNKVLKGYRLAVYKEFQREKVATLKFLKDNNILEKLEKASREKFPEIWSDETEKIFSKKLSNEQLNFINKYINGWDKNVRPEQMEKVFNKWNPIAADMGGDQALRSLGFSMAFHLKDPAMIKELGLRGTKITGGISEKTLKDFQKILVDSYYEVGVSPYEVRKRIKGMFEDTYKGRAMMIARTETAVASSKTQFDTYKNNGIKKKRWLAIVDDRTRNSHEQVSGIVVEIDEYFMVGGNPMLHPHDSNAPPREVIACRCDMTAFFSKSQLPEKENVWAG